MMQRRRRRQVTVAAAPTVTPGAVLELIAARAAGGVGPGSNDPLTTQWFDTSGNGHHGTLSGFAGTTASGYDGSGGVDPIDPYRLVFDGTNDYVQLPELGAASAGGVFSHEAWFLGGATGADRTLTCEGYTGGATPYVTMRLTNSGYLRVVTCASEVDSGSATTLTGTVNLSDGVWHHAVATSDGTDARLYVDGALVAGPAPISVGSYATINSAALGAQRQSTVGRYFNGEIAVARVYPFALSAEQVLQNYAAGLKELMADVLVNPVLELHAARAAGGVGPGSNDPLTTTWFDTSGNGHHGTLSGFSGTPWGGTGTAADPYALTFDGTNDYVQLPKLGAASAGGVFSHEAWFLGGATGADRTLTSEGNTGGATPYVAMRLTNSGYLRVVTCASGSATTLTGTVNLSDGVWHHAVATSDGTDARLYVDGALVAGPAPISVGSYATINSAALGAQRQSTVGRYFNGEIAVARVYPFALSAEQVLQHYAAGPAWYSA